MEAGEPIHDAAIAKSLGVSRTPVREAIHHLVVQGLIEVEPSKTTRVAPLDPAVWADIYEPLVALESIAAARAAKRATSDDLNTLREIQHQFQQAVTRGDLKASRELDLRFHQAVVKTSGNRYLADPIATLKVHRERMGRAYFDEIGPRAESVAEHEELLEAIAQADSDRAAQAMARNWKALVQRIGAVDTAATYPRPHMID